MIALTSLRINPEPRADIELNDTPGRVERPLFIPFYETVRKRLVGQRTLAKFVVVGAMGYPIYQVVLLITSLVAAELSIVGAFIGHNQWTFRDRETVYNPLWVRLSSTM